MPLLEFVLAIDIGSSSIRCSIYSIIETRSSSIRTTTQKENEKDNSRQHVEGCDDENENQNNNDNNIKKIYELGKMAVATYSKPFQTVQPITGYINLQQQSTVPPPATAETTNDTTTSTNTTTTKKNDDHNQHQNINLLDVIDECIDETLRLLHTKYPNDSNNNSRFVMKAVGITSFVMNLIAVNHQGQIMDHTFTISYGCNTRNVNERVKQITETLGPESCQRIYERTGAPIHSAYAVAQLCEIYDNNTNNNNNIDNNVHDIYQWQTIASLCLSRWMKQKTVPISYSEASWTGLFNFHTCQYEPTILKLLPELCRSHLPTAIDYNDIHYQLPKRTTTETSTSTSPVLSNYWDRWPALRNSTFVLGLGDGACANIGSQCTTLNRIACTVGTSAAARICFPYPIVHSETSVDIDDSNTNQKQQEANDETSTCNTNSRSTIPFRFGLFCYRINKYYILIGGALTDGGSAVEWVRQLLRLENHEEFQQCLEDVHTLMNHIDNINDEEETSSSQNVASSDPINLTTKYHQQQQQPLVVIPFLSGERSTGYRTNATGVLYGITRETRPVHVVKSCLESVTLRIDSIIRLLHDIIIVEHHNNNNNNQSQKNPQITPLPRIICSGASLERNDLWRQMIADCTSLDVLLDQETTEGTSRGAAYMALFMNDDGHCELGNDFNESVYKVTKSRKGFHQYWATARETQEKLIETITPMYNDR